MAIETSLSKLQNQVDKLQKENTKLRDLLNAQKGKNKNLQKQIKYMEKTMEENIFQHYIFMVIDNKRKRNVKKRE